VANRNQVTLTFAGDSSDLERATDRVGSSVSDMGRKVDDEASRLDRLGEAGGTAETRFLGLGAGISGVSTIMSGDAGPEDYAMAMADLGDSIEHTVIPLVKQVGTTITSTGRAAVVAAGEHVAAAARTVAGWVVMGVQSMVNAAKMAAAWLISLGPVGLVIAAVGAVIAILVSLGVGFDDLKRWAEAAWSFILGVVQGFIGWLQANWPLVLAILTGPIGLAVLAIVNHWETIKAGFTAVRDWIGARISDVVSFFAGMPGRLAGAAGDLWGWIGRSFKGAINSVIAAWNNFKIPSITIGGWDPPGPGPTVPSFHTPEINTPNIPYLHTGGIFRAPAGQREGLAMLLDGERVTRGPAAGALVVNVTVHGSIRSDRDLVSLIRDELHRGGLR
jgi:hypothetical protein